MIKRKILLPLALSVFLTYMPVFARDLSAEAAGVEGAAVSPAREDFWICPGTEAAMFSLSSAAYGGGLALGYGKGVAVGIKGAWFTDGNGGITTLELDFLLRWFFLGAASGPYIQLNGGPAFIADNVSLSIPSRLGTVSGGLSLGWRFLLGRYWFIDGAIRGGYPYIAGAGLSLGLRL